MKEREATSVVKFVRFDVVTRLKTSYYLLWKALLLYRLFLECSSFLFTLLASYIVI